MSKLLIGGELVDAVKKETYEVRNPATGQVVDHAAKGSEEDVRQAVDAAETAFKEWSDTTRKTAARRWRAPASSSRSAARTSRSS